MVEYGIAAGGAVGHGGGHGASGGLDRWAALLASPTGPMIAAAVAVLVVRALR